MRSGLLALTVLVFVSAQASAATPREARIPLDAAAQIWVKQHDGAWAHWIAAAPDFVNREFAERYIREVVTATPTPTPTPTSPPPQGFEVNGIGGLPEKVSGDVRSVRVETMKTLRSGTIVVRLWVEIDYEPDPVTPGVILECTGPGGVYLIGHGRAPSRGEKWRLVDDGNEGPLRMRFGDRWPNINEGAGVLGSEGPYLPPYTLRVPVRDMPNDQPWSVSCNN